MSLSQWSEKILQLLSRMNNFYSPGSCRASCFRFEINGAQVGWIPPQVAPLLSRFPDVFSPPQGSAVSLRPSLDSHGRRSEAVDAVLQTLRQEGIFSCLKGWRDEKYSVMSKFSEPPLMSMERSATSLFGVKRSGVHINGYTVSDGGEVSMWLARRSSTKQTYPGLLDNVQVVWRLGLTSNKLRSKNVRRRHAFQQPLRRRLVLLAHYTYEDEDGVFPESQYVFDLELPVGFKPKVGDGEVQEFYLLPMDKVKELLATEDFKPNCAMVVLDFLIRHSLIDPDTEPCYQEFGAGLHQTLD
ncbi:thiamin pyrophosphokinase 2 isoform X2 [Eleginops maclovinus]|uniref:thiamin pyrophosphokinase 2 isoform X2 n=1 Tax=Eleginops maclovinus TaxID=56733 RepID=UPI0030807327